MGHQEWYRSVTFSRREYGGYGGAAHGGRKEQCDNRQPWQYSRNRMYLPENHEEPTEVPQMKAVKRFKNSIAHKRPVHMDGILGRESRIVQPPLSMLNPGKISASHKARSLDTDDRNPIETALASEGVHRDINVDSFNPKPPPEKKDSAVSFSAEHSFESPSPSQHDSNAPITPKSTLKAHPSDHHPHTPTGKGQAHNPLDDHLFLAIGPSGTDTPPDCPTVSESPGAVETNIYEKAYQDEVERIREKQGRETTLYLTRRVEGRKEWAEDQGLVKGEKGSGMWGKVLGMARGKAEEGDGERKGEEEGGGVFDKRPEGNGKAVEGKADDKADEKMKDA